MPRFDDAAHAATALESAFTRIERERMAGLPLLHPGLRVEAVDLAPWHDAWLGTLVTPWFLNLVLLPRGDVRWTWPCGERVMRHFGAGDFAFLANEEPETGVFLSCALVSPMERFPDQAHAVATARAALSMLHVEQPAAALMGASACEPSGARAENDRPVAQARKPSRRAILLGPWR